MLDNVCLHEYLQVEGQERTVIFYKRTSYPESFTSKQEQFFEIAFTVCLLITNQQLFMKTSGQYKKMAKIK